MRKRKIDYRMRSLRTLGTRIDSPRSQKIKYRKEACQKCGRICHWRSVDGLCWDCLRKEVGVKERISLRKLGTLEAGLDMPELLLPEEDYNN